MIKLLLSGIALCVSLVGALAVESNHLSHRSLRVEETNYYITFNVKMTVINVSYPLNYYGDNQLDNSNVVRKAIHSSLSLGSDSVVSWMPATVTLLPNQWNNQTFHVFAYVTDLTSDDGTTTVNSTYASLRMYNNLVQRLSTSCVNGSFPAAVRTIATQDNQISLKYVTAVTDVSYNSYTEGVKYVTCNQYCMISPGIAVVFALIGIAFFVGVFFCIWCICAYKDKAERNSKIQRDRNNSIPGSLAATQPGSLAATQPGAIATAGGVGAGAAQGNKKSTVIPERSGSHDEPVREAELSLRKTGDEKEDDISQLGIN